MRAPAVRLVRHERGSVSAEFALALPVLVLVLALCLNALAAMGSRIALHDQVADAARAQSRGQSIHPSLKVTWPDGLVCVEGSRGVGVFAVTATACALRAGG